VTDKPQNIREQLATFLAEVESARRIIAIESARIKYMTDKLRKQIDPQPAPIPEDAL
jgi:hypothetical protein